MHDYAVVGIVMQVSRTRVAVAGASGYAGGGASSPPPRASRVEDRRPAPGGSNAGEPLGVLQPHSTALAERILEATTPEALAGHDVVFLALPHGTSAAIAEALGDDVVVVDCGADFRLADPAAWTTFYGSDHAGAWPYGLPKLPGAREALRGANRIAVLRCYPTVFPALVPPWRPVSSSPTWS